MIKKILLVLTAAFVLLPLRSYAAPSNVEICAKLDINYEDADGGDYYTNNTTDRTAYGIRAKIYYVDSGILIHDNYLNAGTGCKIFQLETTVPHRIRLYSLARDSSANLIDLRNDPTNDLNYYQTVLDNWYPPLNPTSPVTVTWTNTSANVSNMMAALTYSLYLRDGGLSNTTFKVYNTAHPTLGTSNIDGVMYISGGSTEHRDNKFTISHEFGHVLAYFADEGNDPGLSTGYTDTDPDCDTQPHSWNSKEYQVGGAVEGWANFVAASIYNNTSGSDCEYCHPSSCGWNCEVAYYVNFVPHNKWMEGKCSSGFDGYSNEGDWARTYWDLLTKDAVSFNTLMNIYDLADPKNWYSSIVYVRLFDGAASLGYGTPFSNRAVDNGVDW